MRFRLARPSTVAVTAAVAVVASAVVAFSAPAAQVQVGTQPDGSYVTPTNQQLRPYGRQVPFAGRGAAVAVRPGGRTAAVLSVSGAAVKVVDLGTKQVLQETDRAAGPGASRGIAYSPDGKWLYASLARSAVLRFAVRADGTLGTPARITFPDTKGPAESPAGLAVSPDGKRLYIALNRGNALAVVDAVRWRLVTTVPAGVAPNDVAVSGSTVIVTNGGGRRARSTDATAMSSGTRVVVDTAGKPVGGTATLVDATTLRRRAHVALGKNPSGIAVRKGYAFVANANSDTVSVLDVARARVVSTISVRPFPNAPFGSSVNDVATYGTDRLLVTLGRSNALAVYRWSPATRAASFGGMVATPWYPMDVTVDRTYGRVLVANNKGVGSPHHGSVSVLAMPSATALADGTKRVTENNRWADAAAAREPARDVPPVAVPERVGEPSLIEHVFYVIKENRTYDQILGDDPRGNGDPSLVQFGADVTPNQHALARQFPLFDNFYIAGLRSPDAHHWATQAFVSDYSERAYPSYPRGYAYVGKDALSYAPTPFLWENAVRHGKSVRVFGEYANRSDATGTRSDIPSLDPLLVRNYPRFDLDVLDTTRTSLLIQQLQADVVAGTVPNLSIIQLPLDHTLGLRPGKPTPRFAVADNDLALGQFLDWLSHSPIWEKSAVFVFEDDAQNGLDHVDGSRTTAFVVSPYARRGVVDSTYYTQINLIRTIEQILGLPPMNQMDMAAVPMTTAFTDTPDLTPFDVVPQIVPFELNPETATLSRTAAAWATAASEEELSEPDAAPEQLLNRAIWYSVHGFGKPYPGDGRVLSPREVQRLHGDD